MSNYVQVTWRFTISVSASASASDSDSFNEISNSSIPNSPDISGDCPGLMTSLRGQLLLDLNLNLILIIQHLLQSRPYESELLDVVERFRNQTEIIPQV
jgi:hypothetical protein